MIIDRLDRELDKLMMRPNNADTYNNVGVLLYQMCDYDNAELFLRKAYELCPNNESILYNYEIVLYERENYEEALERLRQYHKVNEEDETIIDKIYEIAYLLEDYEYCKNIENGFSANEGEL